MLRRSLCTLFCLSLAACATAQKPPERVSGPATAIEKQEAQAAALQPQGRVLKRKVAVGRFTNQTRYGRSLLLEEEVDPLGKQATDILTNRLVETGRFMVFERPEIELVKAEQQYSGTANLVGVDAIIVGSITEFGRSVDGKTGFLSSTKRQVARAGVEIRLIDAKTGHVFFTASGKGTATVEAGEVAGFGSRAGYDATLNDRAISAAIADLQTPLLNKLQERPWRTDVLSSEDGRIFVSGGSRQGLEVGDMLVIKKRGKTVKSGQTGFEIELPGTEIARARVESFFGGDETSEGAVAVLETGSLGGAALEKLIVEADDSGIQ